MPVIDWSEPHRVGHGPMAQLVGWLRCDRWFTDLRGAESSPSQYSEVTPGRYGTSILGVINGILPRWGVVLVAHYSRETDEPVPPYLSVTRRWW